MRAAMHVYIRFQYNKDYFLIFLFCMDLNEELGRHRGREGKYMCNLCGEDCESVGHFLWNCQAYSERRALFLEHLKSNLGNEFAF